MLRQPVACTACTCRTGLMKLGRTYIWPDGGVASETHAWPEHAQLRVCHGLAQGPPHCRRSAHLNIQVTWNAACHYSSCT
jgi:hypothetical protein